MSALPDFQDPFGGAPLARWPDWTPDALPEDIDASNHRLINQRGEPINLLDFDGVGVTDTQKFISAFALAATTGRPVIVPAGTYQIDVVSLPSNLKVTGDGMGRTIIKAKDGAGISHVFLVPSSSTNITIRDLTIDGNRGTLGTLIVGTEYALGIGGTYVTVERCEIRHSEGIGAFVGDAVISSAHNKFSHCWVHDNGGTTNDAGFGVGIFSGGLTLPTHLTIEHCLLENNYNTVAKPGDSTGINLTMGKGVRVVNNTFINNYNVNGGQLAVSAGGDGSGYINAIVAGNKVYRTGHFGEGADEDQTFGIEIRGRGVNVASNLIDGYVNCAIIFTGSSGQADVIGNTVLGGVLIAPSGGPTAVTLYGSGTDPVSNVSVIGNIAPTVTTGVELNTLNQNIFVGGGNNFSAATTPFTVFGGTTNDLHASVHIAGNILSSSFGRPGEQRTASSAGPVSITSVTPKTVISLSLPKGVWDVFGGVIFVKAATTEVTSAIASLSLTTDTLDTTDGEYHLSIYGFPGDDMGGSTATIGANVPSKRFKLLVTTTIYLVVQSQFAVSTMTAEGKITATEANRIN